MGFGCYIVYVPSSKGVGTPGKSPFLKTQPTLAPLGSNPGLGSADIPLSFLQHPSTCQALTKHVYRSMISGARARTVRSTRALPRGSREPRRWRTAARRLTSLVKPLETA